MSQDGRVLVAQSNLRVKSRHFDAQMAFLHLHVILRAFMMRYPPHRQRTEVSAAALASR